MVIPTRLARNRRTAGRNLARSPAPRDGAQKPLALQFQRYGRLIPLAADDERPGA
jgi:hypothetical protein